MSKSRGRARFGVLVPFTNTNLEPDMVLLRPEGVSMHFARLGGYDQEAIPDAGQMKGLGAADLSQPLQLLQGVLPNVILYGCTSATLTHGIAFDEALAAKIKDASGAQTVTAAGALVHALRILEIEHVGFASPYVPQINEMAIAFLSASGIHTVARADVENELDNYGQGALHPDAVFELGLAADHAHAQAVVLSCTDMRSVEIVAKLEAALGKPVITSNQAMIFQAMQMAGICEALEGYGQLLEILRS
ncbi:MAG: Asp/Glu racemase [Pseudomonadota bacterium]